MKRLITITFAFCISFAQSQSFDHIVYKQDVNQAYLLAVKEAKYAESLQKLEDLKKKYGMLYGEEYLLQSYCHKMMGNNPQAALSLKTCWSTPSFNMRTIWYIDQLQPGKIMEGFNEYENQLVNEGFENAGKNRPKNADSLIQVFTRLIEEDQLVWDEWNKEGENEELRVRIDAMNRGHEAFLENYVHTFGYPGEKQLQMMDQEVWLILVHSANTEEFYQRMKPVFLEEVRKGNMSPIFFANFVDQHQFYKKLPTIYQSLVHDNDPYVNTAKERKQISENRSEIGLVDLEFSHPKF